MPVFCPKLGLYGEVMRNTIASPTQQSLSLLVVYPVPTNKAVTTKSQRCDCFIRNAGNAIPKHACSEAKVSNPAMGRAQLWTCSPLRGNTEYWHVSKEVSGRIIKIKTIKISSATSVV